MLPIPKERRDITEGSTFKRESEINWHATSWLKKKKQKDRQTNRQRKTGTQNTTYKT